MLPNTFIEKDPEQILRYFEEIKALADSEKDGLGFLRQQALLDSIYRQKMLILLDQGSIPNKLLGYLLHSGVFPHAKIQQIATVRSRRKQGIGSALIHSLVQALEQLQYMTIRADVASDLKVALAFYASNGFEPIRTHAGGVSRQRTIVVHIRNLNTETLFDRNLEEEHEIDLGIRQRSAGEAPFYALDLNVYLDLVKEREHSEAARRLFGAALAHEIRLVVANEFVKELKRTSQDETTDPVLQLALRLPRLPEGIQSEQDTLRDELYDLIFVQTGTVPSSDDQPLSDAAHLAHAILARASAFITRDRRVPASRTEILPKFGIDVLTVEELLSILPTEPETLIAWPQFGRNFSCDDVSTNAVREFMRHESFPLATLDEFGVDGGPLVDVVR